MGIVLGTVAGVTITLGAVLSVGATIAGTAVSISTSLYSANQQAKQARAQGKAQQQMANYNARVAENTQIAANQNAEAEMNAAREKTKRQRADNQRLRDKQLTIQATSGGTYSGSALLIDQDQLAEMKLGELDIMHEGKMKAREHKLQGMSAGAEAVGSKFSGQLARTSANRRAKSFINQGYVKSIGAGVKGATSLASSVANSYKPATKATF